MMAGHHQQLGDHPEAGFTLIEFLVAVTLLALISGFGVTILQTVDKMLGLKDHNDRAFEIAAVQRHLRTSLQQAQRVFFTPDDQDGVRIAFLGRADRLYFVTHANPKLERGGLYAVSYELIADAPEKTLVTRRRIYRSYLPLELDEDAPAFQLMEAVSGMQFRYFGAHDPDQPELSTWGETWETFNALPKLVEITVTFTQASSSRAAWPPLTVQIPMGF